MMDELLKENQRLTALLLAEKDKQIYRLKLAIAIRKYRHPRANKAKPRTDVIKKKVGRPPALDNELKEKLPSLVAKIKQEKEFTTDIEALRHILKDLPRRLGFSREKESQKLAFILSKARQRNKQATD